MIIQRVPVSLSNNCITIIFNFWYCFFLLTEFQEESLRLQKETIRLLLEIRKDLSQVIRKSESDNPFDIEKIENAEDLKKSEEELKDMEKYKTLVSFSHI